MDIIFTGVLCMLLFSAIIPKTDAAAYLYGLGFSPVAWRGRGNYGIGYPYSPYGYGYGGSNDGGAYGGMGGGFYGAGLSSYAMNDWTLRTSAFGLGYGHPYYG